MTCWIARYREGFVNTDGDSIVLADEVRRGSCWNSLWDARHQWLALEALATSSFQTFGNGFMQTDDVSNRRVFQELGVVRIWRTVAFEPCADHEGVVERD